MTPGTGERPPTRGVRDAIEDEVRFHLEGRAEELMAAGLPSEEAWRKARAAFGDVDRVRAEMRAIGQERERRKVHREMVSGFARDVAAGFRGLLRSRGYAIVAVLTLALGIGASVGMFTVLNAVLLRPLPFPSADRLVRVWPAENFNISLAREVGSALPSIERFTGISHWGLTLTGEGEPAVLHAAAVDAGYFEVFGVEPLLGRAFTKEETDPARSGVVLLGHLFWQNRFGGDATIVGRRVRLSGYDHETRVVIGVMPPGHQTLRQEADVWIPLHLEPGRSIVSDSSWYVNELVARLGPGGTVREADAQLRTVVGRLRTDFPGRIDEEIARSASVISLRDAEVGDVRRALWTLLAAVGLVLLIACANLANLALARATGRRQEMAVRSALGAGRWRLVRQQLAEGTVIAAIGAAAGMVVARGMLAAARVSEASGLPRAAHLSVDWRVLVFTFATATAALMLFGLLPALRATGSVLRGDLQSWTRTVSRDRGTHRLNRLLVTAEIALATVLTTGAALVLSSFVAVRSVDPGMDATDVLTVEVMPPQDRYTSERAIQYYAALRERLSGLPGVETVGGIHLLPFTYANWGFPYLAEGHAPPADDPLPSANFRILTGDYLGAVDQPLLEGRAFDEQDRAGSPAVMLINRTMANLLWPGESAVGREIAIFGNIATRVVGVVGDVHQHALDREPMPEMYVPFPQWAQGVQMVFMLEGRRSATFAADVQRVIGEVDPNVPITSLQPLANVLGDSLAGRRFLMVVMTAFGLLALLLGAVGVYGVMSNLVGVRLPDFGLQLALGARPADVVRSALSSGLLPAVAGLFVGIVAAGLLSGVLRGMLFGIEPLDAPTYLVVATVLLTVATLASWLPARRAAKSDPLEVLRAE